MVRRAVKLFKGAHVERTIEKTIHTYKYIYMYRIFPLFKDYLQMLARSPIVFAVEICFAIVEILILAIHFCSN